MKKCYKRRENLMTVEKLIELDQYARQHIIEPLVVATDEEAADMNRLEKEWSARFPELVAHKWKKGDKYYDISQFRKGGEGAMLSESDRKVLEDAGWEVVRENPPHIRCTFSPAVATGIGVWMVVAHIRQRATEKKKATRKKVKP